MRVCACMRVEQEYSVCLGAGRNDSELWPGKTWWEDRDWRSKEPVHSSAVEGAW